MSRVAGAIWTMFQYFLSILVAAWFTAALAAPITSVSNFLWLESVSMPVDWMTAATIVVKDIFRFGAILSAILVASYLLAFIVTSIVRIWLPAPRWLAYGLAAAVAMLAMLILLVETTFQVQFIAGNRTLPGTAAHVLAAFIGGMLFAGLIRKRRTGAFAIRVLGCVPLFFMIWNAFNWGTDPFTASSNMGVELSALSVDGQSTVIRDLTAFFISSATVLLVAMYSLNYRWFLAVAILFFYAALFNYLNGELRDISSLPALIFEVAFSAWMLLLGLAAGLRSRKSGRPVPEPEDDREVEATSEMGSTSQQY